MSAAPPVDPLGPRAAALEAEAILADVRWLVSPELLGRGPGDGAGRAAERIARELAAAGLTVSRRPIPGAPGEDNVIGILGGDADVVVVCAHYDHLGVKAGALYAGADDNASGVAVMLALARTFGATHTGHTVVFLASGAEEAGLRGTEAYVADPPLPLARTRAVINFDMVGRRFFEAVGGRDRSLGAIGLESDAALAQAALAAARAEDVELVPVTAGTLKVFGFDGHTDDYWFRQRGVPAVNLSTGMHPDYHRPTDTIDRLSPAQLRRVARVAARILVEMARLERR